MTPLGDIIILLYFYLNCHKSSWYCELLKSICLNIIPTLFILLGLWAFDFCFVNSSFYVLFLLPLQSNFFHPLLLLPIQICFKSTLKVFHFTIITLTFCCLFVDVFFCLIHEHQNVNNFNDFQKDTNVKRNAKLKQNVELLFAY